LLASEVFDDVTYHGKLWVLALAALVFVLVNALVRPVLILLALPAIILSLGIALLLVNALMLYLTDWIVGPFDGGRLWTTVGAALIIWLVNLAVHRLFKPEAAPARQTAGAR